MNSKNRHAQYPQSLFSKAKIQRFNKSFMQRRDSKSAEKAQSLNGHSKSTGLSVANIPMLRMPINTLKKKLVNTQGEQIKKLAQEIKVSLSAQAQFQKRLIKNNLYYQYDFNPFLVQNKKSAKQIYKELLQCQTNRSKPKVNVLEAVWGQRPKMLQKELEQKMRITSDKNIENRIKKIQKRYSPAQIPTLQDNFYPKPSQLCTPIKQIKQISKKNELQELQQIASIQQKSFFREKRDREYFNLFQVIKNPDHVMFQSGKKQLQKQKFEFILNKYIDSNFVIKASNKGISTYARSLVENMDSNDIPWKYELADIYFDIKVNKLQGKDLLFIVSGQLSPDVAICKLEDYADQQTQYTVIKNFIYREPKRIPQVKQKAPKGIKINIGSPNYQISQFQYKKLALYTQKQRQNIQISQEHLLQFRQLLEKQMRLLQKRIKDKKSHKKIESRKNRILKDQITKSKDLRLYSKQQIQKSIEKNKVNKTRTERLAINELNIKLALKKKIEKQLSFRPHSKQTAKSKSKSKSKQTSFRGNLDHVK